MNKPGRDPEQTRMGGPESTVGNQVPGPSRAEQLSQMIECEHPLLCRRIGTLVYRLCGRLRPQEVADRVQEVLNEAVRRALQAAESFDPQRSATAWLLGFALRILLEQRRGQARRAVVQSDLGEQAWRNALDQLCCGDSANTETIRLDIRQALTRLDAEQRRAVQLRYFQGLDGEELAREMKVPTAGAARVRVARALQALRKQFRAAASEEQT
jgi:RNA polymerase sigma factor (sigma-70 family)